MRPGMIQQRQSKAMSRWRCDMSSRVETKPLMIGMNGFKEERLIIAFFTSYQIMVPDAPF